MKKIIYALIIFLVLITPVLIAQEDIGDIKVKGIELEKVLSFINGIIAFALFLITFIAYKRDGKTRLFYVCLAFLIFSIKSFLVSSELFITGLEFIDPLSIILDLIALLFFFFGILKKGG